MLQENIMERVSKVETGKINKALPFIVCCLAGLFYLYEFVLQVSPGVMTTELMRDLKLNAAGLGAMAAFYYYAYTPMQIPAGLLYDRFGPRILITLALLVCACGAFFFGLTDNVAMASAGRFFMGIGSAFSFIGSLVLVSRWFPPKYFALLAGIIQLMSSIGAILGEAPLAGLVEKFGWRHTIMSISVIGVVLSAVVWLIVRDHPPGKRDHHHTVVKPGELRRLGYVCGQAQSWWIAIYSFTCWAPITAFAALWGVPYLAVAYNISTPIASTACSMIWIGIGVGSPLIGWWSDRIGLRRLPLYVASNIGVVSVFSVIYISHLPLVLMYTFLFLFGIAASGQSLSFGLVKDINRPQVVGTAIGFNNMAVVLGGAIFQPLVGILLNWHWSGETVSGAPVYSVADYRIALAVLPLCYVLGLIISLYKIKESNCQARYDIHGNALDFEEV
jgi:MFS family permease